MMSSCTFKAKSSRKLAVSVTFLLGLQTHVRHVLAQSSINASADPWVVNYSAMAGPDEPGPWNALMQAVDFPSQNITMLPSLTETSLFIETGACSGQDTACPLTTSVLWSPQSDSHALFYWANSSSFEASSWDTTTEPLELQGSGIFTDVRMSLERADSTASSLDVDGIAVTASSDYTATYPNSSTYYTMEVGLLSLWANLTNITWTGENGSSVTCSPFLSRAYTRGHIPSISYGLHVGSYYPEVSGSLVLGGYDRSRCISTPIVSSGQGFSLVNVSLIVGQGGTPYVNASNSSIEGLLQNKGNAVSSINVLPNPGVPYMYLPGDTCTAIANHLPVTFDSSLGLYLWNTSDSAFEKIVSSPAALQFTFQSDDGSGQISVPFALLNLTLEQPLTNTPTQYFPCSPYTPTDSTYHLGRAFLQAAFLGQNWQTERTFLAQAPGPGKSAEAVTKLNANDDTLAAMKNPPSWLDTWHGHLSALPGDATAGSNTTSSDTKTSSDGLSGGAIAGIVVGVIAGVALLGLIIFFAFRRRKSKTPESGGYAPPQEYKAEDIGPAPSGYTLDSPPLDGRNEVDGQPIHEVESPLSHVKPKAAEMEAPDYIGELEGSRPYRL